jgi:hypothetical protein
MIADPLAARVRAAADRVPVPPFPAVRIAARLATAAPISPDRGLRAPWVVGAGAVVLAAALAVGVPTVRTVSPAFLATMSRLTGHDYSGARGYAVPRMSLEEARKHTAFPIVVPAGKRVLDAQPYPNDAGISLDLAVDYHAQAILEERWAGTPRSKLDGVGIHDDGSIRRFNVHRWRIGKVEFSLTMFDATYHRYAEEVERATREAAAQGGG